MFYAFINISFVSFGYKNIIDQFFNFLPKERKDRSNFQNVVRQIRYPALRQISL